MSLDGHTCVFVGRELRSRAADHIVALSSPANRHREKDKKKKKGRMTEKEGKNERNEENQNAE